MRMRFFVVLIVGCVITVAGFLMLFCSVLQQPSSPEAKLRNIVIEFLKTADVSKVLMDDTVSIEEVYDHKLSGEILVVEYTTTSMGHPTFMLEALEHHIAVITLNADGEVVSAFCIHGKGVFWDLVNQKWFRA